MTTACLIHLWVTRNWHPWHCELMCPLFFALGPLGMVVCACSTPEYLRSRQAAITAASDGDDVSVKLVFLSAWRSRNGLFDYSHLFFTRKTFINTRTWRILKAARKPRAQQLQASN